MTPETARELAVAAGAGTLPGMEILRRRGEDVLIARVPEPEQGTVIVKCWNRRGLRGTLRRLTRSNIGYREATALRRLESLGTSAPRCLAYVTLPSAAAHTEALISSDLGTCTDSTEHFKALLKQNDTRAVADFDATLIRITRRMIDQGLLDPDHRLPNIVMDPGQRPVRIDFELCLPVRFPRLHPRRLGDMIGVFLGSYVFAVQPDLPRAEAFALALFREIPLPAAVIRRAQTTLDAMVERQRDETGIHSPLNLLSLHP